MCTVRETGVGVRGKGEEGTGGKVEGWESAGGGGDRAEGENKEDSMGTEKRQIDISS